MIYILLTNNYVDLSNLELLSTNCVALKNYLLSMNNYVDLKFLINRNHYNNIILYYRYLIFIKKLVLIMR